MDKSLVIAKLLHFSPLWAIDHNSVADIAMCVSLRPSVTVRDRLARREQFINIICNDKYLDICWTPKHFGLFWTAFLISIELRIIHNLINVRILHL